MKQRMGMAACWLLLAAATQAAQDPPSREQACRLNVNNYLGAGGAERLEKDGRPCSQACAAGYAEGCYSLGVLHRIVDSPAAIGFLRQACDLGQAAGCQDLGAAYRFGSGVPKDDAQGIRLYERACRLAQVTACTDLGMLYADGEVVARDRALAGSWYRQAAQLRQAACAKGSPLDCSYLADMLLNGQGGPSDPAQAAALYRKACTSGYPHACYSLAQLYQVGQGTPRSPWRARWMLQRSCRGAFPPACRALYGPAGPSLCDPSVLLLAGTLGVLGALALARLVAHRRVGWLLPGLALLFLAGLAWATLWMMDLGLRTLLLAALLIGPLWLAVALFGWRRQRRHGSPRG